MTPHVPCDAILRCMSTASFQALKWPTNVSPGLVDNNKQRRGHRPPSSVRTAATVAGQERGCTQGMEACVLGDFNVDWLVPSSMKEDLNNMAAACNLTQVVEQSTRKSWNSAGYNTSTCIDLAFVTSRDNYGKAGVFAWGCTDHDIITITKRTKIPKRAPTSEFKRSYKAFVADDFMRDIARLPWDLVQLFDNVEDAVDVFIVVVHCILLLQ
ncbi:Alpha-(1,6)-fucosyltransferase [Branchiostoma belcheri]|nr:Alpha-(1,6)-fucosyltransferase [Branchiostoma belcheri]